MNNEQTVALSKIVKKVTADNARNKVLPGVHQIAMTVEITGTITVGEDYDTAPTVSIPLKKALALFMLYSGQANSQAASAMLVKALYDSIENTGTSQQADFAQHEAAVDALIGQVEQDIIQKLPRVYRRGPVTTQLNIAEQIAPVNELEELVEA